MTWRILQGDCREHLRGLDAGSVQTCVTSPPYFGLRDYGHDGQIGLEPTPDEFVSALVGVFREVRRVLRDDGTVWLNLGDSYAASIGGVGNNPSSKSTLTTNNGRGPKPGDKYALGNEGKRVRLDHGVKSKDLLGIPWMVAFALRADGWYLRSDIIWSKPNPMPESVTDRPTKAHEYLFLLSKSARYFYDADAIRETWADNRNGASGAIASKYDDPGAMRQDGGVTQIPAVEGRNKRSVWTIATQPYPGAHFATFPPKLIEPCILAGCPERACGECGAPWELVVEVTREPDPTVGHNALRGAGHMRESEGGPANREGREFMRVAESRTVGFKLSCDHPAPPVPGVVLDPFAGAGTTGVVALRHGRSFIGCELNPEYVELARRRIVDDAPLLNQASEVAA